MCASTHVLVQMKKTVGSCTTAVLAHAPFCFLTFETKGLTDKGHNECGDQHTYNASLRSTRVAHLALF